MELTKILVKVLFLIFMIIGLLDQEKNTIKLNYDIFYFFFNLIIIVNLIIILKDQKLIYQNSWRNPSSQSSNLSSFKGIANSYLITFILILITR